MLHPLSIEPTLYLHVGYLTSCSRCRSGTWRCPRPCTWPGPGAWGGHCHGGEARGRDKPLANSWGVAGWDPVTIHRQPDTWQTFITINCWEIQAKTCSNLGPTSSKLTGHENRTVPPVSYVWGWTTTCVSWASIWWMSSQNIVSQAGSISLHYNDSWNLVLIVVQYSLVGLQHYNSLVFVIQTYFVSFQNLTSMIIKQHKSKIKSKIWVKMMSSLQLDSHKCFMRKQGKDFVAN